MNRKKNLGARLANLRRRCARAAKAWAAMARSRRRLGKSALAGQVGAGLAARLSSCLQTILDLEPNLERLSVGHVLLKEFQVLRAFLDKMDQVKVNEAEVRRIESATERFLWELRGPISYVELTNNMEYVIQ